MPGRTIIFRHSLVPRRAADTVGGLKEAAHRAAPYRGLGAVSHRQAGVGIYRAIACRYYRTPFHNINYFALFRPQLGQQAHWGAYPAH